MKITCTEPAALFLFAHQDDEFGVFQTIVDEREKGHRVCCAYLTDGGFNGVSPQRRNRESLSVLQRMGVQPQDVFFAGDRVAIPDGKLHEHLAAAAGWIDNWLAGFTQVVSICVPAWEGGHHDHDVLHAITVVIAERRSMTDYVRQFPLYNAHGCVGPFFKVLHPLPLNGPVEETAIPWGNRFRFLRNCLGYPSQAVTWMGIFPFAVFHYLVSGKQALQPVLSARLNIRPHDGVLYYEMRGFFTWAEMDSCLSAWRNGAA
ncbi:PIG-L family deacetylase [Candidatus Methylospira mobilis]|uniref:PIG-L deacetylase family protein n=1 Tax=Candidatus Methylospira mobilis TaxID=1808979 RepID=UPI0028E4A1F5|nr:PIG-L family deacetylase [Candidatus Methylospira mobilis]WNV06080.1 PIG-L family deacetylase [Candidatus Methylospira mobilis]